MLTLLRFCALVPIFSRVLSDDDVSRKRAHIDCTSINVTDCTCSFFSFSVDTSIFFVVLFSAENEKFFIINYNYVVSQSQRPNHQYFKIIFDNEHLKEMTLEEMLNEKLDRKHGT